MKGVTHQVKKAHGAPRSPLWWLVVTTTSVIAVLAVFGPTSWWQRPDQRAQRLFDHGEFAAAAALFTDSQRRGVALFRAAEFEAAAAAFARVDSAQGHFNRGNALVMRGNYEDAIAAYQRSLALRADWPAAANNLEIARLRAERTRLKGGDMTGGKMGADDVVFDTRKNDDQNKGGQEQVEGGEQMSDAQLQALWLRRVQTKPAAFMRAKFALQLAAKNDEEVARR